MTQILHHADLDDLFAADAIRDPYAFFGRLRETDPVHWNARYQLWIITRHADVLSIVRDHAAFSSAVIQSDRRPPYPPLDDNGLTLLDEVRSEAPNARFWTGVDAIDEVPEGVTVRFHPGEDVVLRDVNGVEVACHLY